ncbi:hypothetical protein PF005_g2108 [Phytophthora fragariae]|uniref:Elicitin n=1 Tax=Phytophthora fragariae TaxID=53985 RepID=A0A6A3FVL3_9STRA|nr:hypothetical protein PF003_g35142 [Phytophthora fragariae]KAE8948160.1 hypothetical protein PF009_g2255 [Phytophthora fragariae]KAE9124670.1 hypothetical protein PF010_g5914 [Phytophthora fragariae]KAE9136677.1 hypothetical protein PF007_g2096 [Phytophthora fragariae]KAE9149767.1 hypothetical protein PF006_g5798 [Phytophthora fragariae]
MKAAIFSLLLVTTAFANAAVDCDKRKLTSIANSDDASSCQLASNFVAPVESTASTILTNLESFCADASCERVLDAFCTVSASAQLKV